MVPPIELNGAMLLLAEVQGIAQREVEGLVRGFPTSKSVAGRVIGSSTRSRHLQIPLQEAILGASRLEHRPDPS